MTLTFTVSPPLPNSVITLDSANKLITFFNDDDISLVGQYEIALTGTFGSTFVASNVENFALTISNPCLDPDFVTIQSPTLALPNYVINGPVDILSYTHDAA